MLSAQQKCFGRLMLVPGKPEGFLICQAGVWGKREPPCLAGGGGSRKRNFLAVDEGHESRARNPL